MSAPADKVPASRRTSLKVSDAAVSVFLHAQVSLVCERKGHVAPRYTAKPRHLRRSHRSYEAARVVAKQLLLTSVTKCVPLSLAVVPCGYTIVRKPLLASFICANAVCPYLPAAGIVYVDGTLFTRFRHELQEIIPLHALCELHCHPHRTRTCPRTFERGHNA